MNELNNFFETATPAQINQLHTAPPEPVQEQQHHPMIQAAIPTMDALPEIEYVEAAPEVPVVHEAAPLPPASQPEQTESPQQLRFREIREAKLKAEWERDEMARRLQALEQAQTRQPEREEPEEDFGIDPDAVLEGKDLNKIVKQIEKRVEKRAEKKYQQQQHVMMQNVVENRLKMEMPDIDSVLSNDNVQKLNQMYPELAQSIGSNPDYYTKAKAAYTLMKRLNIVPDPQAKPAHDYDADRARIAQNVAKPRAVQTVAPRQSGLAASNSYDNDLTQTTKDQLWKEMQKAMRG